MKKLLYFISLVVVLLMAACSSNNTPESQAEAAVSGKELKVVERAAPGYRYYRMVILFTDGGEYQISCADKYFLLQKGDTVEFQNGEIVGIRFCHK